MDAAILFYLAHRTSACQRTIARACGFFGVDPDCIAVCARRQDLNGCLSKLLRDKSVVFLVSAAGEKRPDCAAPVFQTLRVPLDRAGEPKGILKLRGAEQTGYLVESVNQAIALLPDDPYEILRMAPALFVRLKTKFSLEGDVPPRTIPAAELGEKIRLALEEESGETPGGVPPLSGRAAQKGENSGL